MKTTISQLERIASYKTCCDYIYQNTAYVPSEQNTTYSIWCHTHHLENLLAVLSTLTSNTKYVIVAHASDCGITKNIMDSVPNNVIKIFGQNVTHKDPRVESIPIGSIGSTWIGSEAFAVKHQDDGSSLCEEYCQIHETGQEKQFKNLALMDFAIQSDPTRRQNIYDHFSNKNWVTTNLCDAPLESHRQTAFHSLNNYYKDIYNHKFIISPMGNGEDCGRNWQALYLGSIPIIPRHVNIEYYENDLPFLIYDDINMLTEDYLNQKWEEMSNRKYNLEKATLSYWKNKITSARK